MQADNQPAGPPVESPVPGANGSSNGYGNGVVHVNAQAGPSTLRTGTPPTPPGEDVIPHASPEAVHAAEQDLAAEVAELRERERELEVERPCLFKSISPVRSSIMGRS